jgi:hypothetical protein
MHQFDIFCTIPVIFFKINKKGVNLSVKNTIKNEYVSQDTISEKLYEIIRRIKNINIESKNDSLFCVKYYIAPEEFAYILLMASKELNFEINTEFVDSLESCSFNNIVNSIMKFKIN